MPNRILRDWTDSETINKLSIQAERFLVRLIMKVDDYGRFYANASLLKANLYPLLLESIREADISRWVAECQKAGVIVVYEVSNKNYIQIAEFKQQLRQKKERFPGPEKNAKHMLSNSTSIDSPETETETKQKLETEDETEDETESEDGKIEKIIYPFNSVEFKVAWYGWTNHLLKEHKKPYHTFSAEQAALTDLAGFSLNDESRALHNIKYSISKNWKSLHADKDYGKQQKLTREEQREQVAELGRDALSRLLSGSNGEIGQNGATEKPEIT